MSFEDLPLFPEPEARTPSGSRVAPAPGRDLARGEVLRGEVPATSGTEAAGSSDGTGAGRYWYVTTSSGRSPAAASPE